MTNTNWQERFDEKFQDGEFRASFKLDATPTKLKAFISQLLQDQLDEVLELAETCDRTRVWGRGEEDNPFGEKSVYISLDQLKQKLKHKV